MLCYKDNPNKDIDTSNKDSNNLLVIIFNIFCHLCEVMLRKTSKFLIDNSGFSLSRTNYEKAIAFSITFTT